MKHFKNLLGCLLLFATIGLSAQAPEGVNYQAVARDNGGAVLANENLTVRMTIKEGGPAGTTVFQETHNVSTNDFGLFDLIIGQGSIVTGTFSSINWGSSSHFLQVEVDDGTGYVNLGTSQFVSVPYALYAKSAGGGGGTSYTAGAGIDISGNVISNTGDTDASDDVTSSSNAGGDASGTFGNLSVVGLQGRSVSASAPSSGQVLKWNGSAWAPGNDVGGGAGDNWGSQVVQTDATLSGNGVSGNELGIAQQGANNGQVLKWNGSAWVPQNDNDNNTTYAAGTGLSLSGTTFINTGDTDASDDITNSTNAGGDLKGPYPNPSVIKLQGNQMNAQNPNDGDVLQWDNGISRWVNVPMESSPWKTNGSDIYYNNGNVGIGTANPDQALEISQNSSINYIQMKSTNTGFTAIDGTLFGISTSGSGDFVIFNQENTGLRFATNATDRMFISGAGNVGIGTNSPSNDLHIIQTGSSSNALTIEDDGSGNSWILGVGLGSDNFKFAYNSAGAFVSDISNTTGAYNQLSDRRAKKDLEPMEMVLPKIMQLDPQKYHYKTQSETTPKSYGFIAQDVEKIFPSFVSTGENMKGLAYDNFAVISIKAIQEQQQQIDQLIKENQELKNRVEQLESR